MNKTSISSYSSRFSIFLSSLCVVHCLSVPVIVFLLPTVSFLFNPLIELVLILSVVPLSFIGFYPTWKKHQNKQLMILYVSSLAMLLISQFAFGMFHSHGTDAANTASLGYLAETLLLIFGASGLGLAIYKNNKHTHVCSNPHHKH
ncbi:MAG: MerC domain-containing protein [Balneolales bacterium]|nr:MerC domain-containing protein [Balneolales bacterium]